MVRVWGCVALLVVVCSCGSSKSDDVAAGGGAQMNGGAGSSNTGGNAGSAGARAGAGGVDASHAGNGGASPGSLGGEGNEGGASGEGGEGGSDLVNGCSTGNIRLRATSVSGTLKIHGAPFTGTLGAQEYADLILRSADGDIAKLTTIAPNASSYAALVVPGSYDLYYRHDGVGSTLPVNDVALLQHGIVVGAAPVSLDIDLPVVTISGKVTVDGQAINDPTSQGKAVIGLVGSAGGKARISDAAPDGGSYSAHVLAGSYDLYFYGGLDPVPLVPVNYVGKFRSGVVVGGSAMTLDIDVPTTTVSVGLTVNGAPLTAEAALSLRNATDVVGLSLTSASGSSYSARVVPGGTYDLIYTARSRAANAPQNNGAVIRTGIVVGTSPLSLNVDIAASPISGTLSSKGAAPISTDNGGFELVTASGDRVAIPIANGAFSALVVRGTYDVYLNGWLAGIPGLPISTVRLESGVVVGASPVSLDVHIPTPTVVSGTVTLNGAPPPTNHPISLYIADGMNQGMSLTLGGSAYSTLVFPGSYDLSYGNGGDSELPNNYGGVTLKTGIVVGASPLTLNVDVPGASVSGVVRFNGGAPGALAKRLSAAFTLASSTSSGELIGTVPEDGSYSALFVPGTYELYYGANDPGNVLPSNEHADLGCFIVR